MPYSDKLQPDFDNEPEFNHQQQSNSLSSEIDDLQKGIRVDFDQKISDLTNLLQRFKALVISPNRLAANEPDALALQPATPTINTSQAVSDQAVVADNDESLVSPNSDNIDTQVVSTNTQSAFAAESARFETGLYKLNCQLYRFRLELDQEMEFREEPLHIHFNQESELSRLLQEISDRSSEKNP